VPVARFRSEPVPLFAAYSLNVHNRSELREERLQGMDRFHALNRDVYRRRFIQKTQLRRTHFRILSAVADCARITRVTRPDDPSAVQNLAARIEQDLDR